MKVKISEIALVTAIIIQSCCEGLDVVPKKSDQQQVNAIIIIFRNIFILVLICSLTSANVVEDF